MKEKGCRRDEQEAESPGDVSNIVPALPDRDNEPGVHINDDEDELQNESSCHL